MPRRAMPRTHTRHCATPWHDKALPLPHLHFSAAKGAPQGTASCLDVSSEHASTTGRQERAAHSNPWAALRASHARSSASAPLLCRSLRLGVGGHQLWCTAHLWPVQRQPLLRILLMLYTVKEAEQQLSQYRGGYKHGGCGCDFGKYGKGKELRDCFECGMWGHITANCPSLWQGSAEQ